MALGSVFGSRALSLAPAFVRQVQSAATSAGSVSAKICGQKYVISYVKETDMFCVQPGKTPGGLLSRLLGGRGPSEVKLAALELQFNNHSNPVKAYNEHVGKILESRV
ncbi:TPA: hypothetical protein NU484_005379 [Escherichia coli]|uniref:hypothetical protein n=1 Tax=Escherichia coli TaxID=562 RepID=UPI000BB8D507|nr:hypothetical protein [Escherichia coli]EFD2590550.1 hypothetical protein [Escherichia coli]EFD2621923.1 hypothetical protein [Escherichia coli]EGW2588192.1 hypothetical protein [Escherichia coli]EHQ1214670.1 hypothetical protein [Escherichia coli]EHW2979622.1 hypothetical protein [Escherichia coli]